MCGRKQNKRVVVDAHERAESRQQIKQSNVHNLMARSGHPPVLALAVTADDKRAARVVVIFLIGGDRLFVNGRSARIVHAVQAPFGKQQNKEERRKKASQLLFL